MIHYIRVHVKSVKMKNITFSADDELIRKARDRARRENTTLNQRFREWLEDYSRIDSKKSIKGFLEEISIDMGGPFTRDEMNERR